MDAGNCRCDAGGENSSIAIARVLIGAEANTLQGMVDPNLPADVLNLLACPVCGNQLVAVPSAHLCCLACARRFPVVDGIPVLLADRAIVEPHS
jgi:hypothetical protein